MYCVVCLSLQRCSLLYFALIKLSLDWRYLVSCCLFVITMVFTTLLCLDQSVFRLEVLSIVFVITKVFTTLLCLDQAVFRLEVFSIVLSVCHYNGVHYFTLPWSISFKLWDIIRNVDTRIVWWTIICM